METEKLYLKSQSYLEKLCVEIPERCVGSEGNRMATRFFEQEISSYGWDTELQEFEANDWHDDGANLQADSLSFEVFVSPYSLSCDAEEQLISVSSIEELKQIDIKGKIVLLHGEIAKEQLMPKNFVFYNPEEHQQIISLLEKSRPKAIISATRRNAALAGGVYPFPLIEDGDFDIPSVYMTEDEGSKLLPYVGKTVVLKSISKRIQGKGCNVIARKGRNLNGRIVIAAHIDAKKGSPGAIDNATGVITLLLLAELLKDYDENRLIEIVAFNGEDYYAASGQMLYIINNQNKFSDIILNITVDGAGYREGKSVFSFFGLPDELRKKVEEVMNEYNGITEGVQYPQGDHSIFVQNGCPAIAVSSKWLIDNLESQHITHTSKDNVDIVDCKKIVEIAQALNRLIT
ncbi:MAG: M28 family peptidase [Chloroflexota bacterium]|nr:M28 family peptidase [Chloroflexota bacterium]